MMEVFSCQIIHQKWFTVSGFGPDEVFFIEKYNFFFEKKRKQTNKNYYRKRVRIDGRTLTYSCDVLFGANIALLTVKTECNAKSSMREIQPNAMRGKGYSKRQCV